MSPQKLPPYMSLLEPNEIIDYNSAITFKNNETFQSIELMEKNMLTPKKVDNDNNNNNNNNENIICYQERTILTTAIKRTSGAIAKNKENNAFREDRTLPTPTKTLVGNKTRRRKYPIKFSCKLCRKNGEPMQVYSSHDVKGEDGKVTCPILAKYVCEICGATGEEAHTKKYCPMLAQKENIVPELIPKYRVLSNGKTTGYINHK